MRTAALACIVPGLAAVALSCSNDAPDTGSQAAGGASGAAGWAGGSGASAGAGGATAAPGTGGTVLGGGAPGQGGASSPGGTPGQSGTPGAGGLPGGGTTGSGGSAGGQAGSGGANGGTPGAGVDGGNSTPDGSSVPTIGVDTGSGTCGGGAAQSSDVTINVSSVQQRIRGFGCSSAWAGNLNNATNDPDMLWSTTKGAGLSLLRIRYGDGLGVAKAAAKAGVTVWMTPWGTGANGSPGGPVTAMQTNPNGCKGSMPVLTDGQTLAKDLVSWVQNAKSQGVPIYAVSAENEPDSCGINQTTSYSPAQLATWIASYLGPAMNGIGVKVMAPETMNGCGFTSYFSAIQSNADAWKNVSIFASHEYGCGTQKSQPSIAAAGKEYWETEVDTGAVNGDSDGMPSALHLAQTIHDDLTKANLNAFHYWWLWAGGTSGLYDTTTKAWRKALWVMGNFSRFARPGYIRVASSGTPPSGVAVSAYVNPTSKALVIVAINNNTSSTNLPLYVSGAPPCKLIPWETSSSKNLVQDSPVTVASGRVSLTLDGQSVTTFVGMP
jgi:glucuronoarabinoxylan endo-1,4-beta-xylanase